MPEACSFRLISSFLGNIQVGRGKLKSTATLGARSNGGEGRVVSLGAGGGLRGNEGGDNGGEGGVSLGAGGGLGGN